MRALAWGDELCGQVVTPESWAGGVIERADGFGDSLGWHYSDVAKKEDCDCTCCRNYIGSRPIFAPRGWAGKTDAELWEAVFGAERFPADDEDDEHIHYKMCDLDGNFEVDHEGRIWGWIADSGDSQEILDPQALILALQNAAVLQARLRTTP